MVHLSVLICFSSLLLVSLSSSILTAKPEPVELSSSCMTFVLKGYDEHPDLKPSDVPIILLHGMGGSKKVWEDISPVLISETKRKTCRVDLRNHGESPWNSDEYDVEAMTEDVKHYLDELQVPKAILLGQSLGGKIAVHLALTYPERVEKIIVEDMKPNGITPEDLQEMQFMAKIMKELDNDIPQGVEEIEAKEAFLKLLNERLEKMNMSFTLNDPSIVPIKCSDGRCQWRFNPVLRDALLRNVDELLNESSGRFDGPALFIYGGKSNSKVGDDESNIKKLFPNAKLVEVEKAGHILYTFKEFTREVIKFINEEQNSDSCYITM